MKIFQLFLSVILLGAQTYATAQQEAQPVSVKKSSVNIGKPLNTSSMRLSRSAGVTPIWSDDFSNPSNWVISKDPTTTDNWEIGTTPPLHTLNRIKSNTASNGFALFDSDKLCSRKQIAFISTASPIDLSAHPFVKLNFQQNYGKFYDSTFVSISTDGATFYRQKVNAEYINNDFSTNPENVSMDISALAGGKKTVWLRFSYYSITPSTAKDTLCGYSWQVDDVALYDIPQNDITLNKAFTEVGSALFYSQIPKTQIDTVRFLGLVSNTGTAKQTGVKLNVNLSDGNKVVYNQNSFIIDTVRYLERDTFAILKNYFLPPAKNSTYTITLKATQSEVDADTTNNIIIQKFSVTDSVFARDKGDLVTSGYTSPNIYKGVEMDASVMGILYGVVQNDIASSVSVYIDSLTSLNTSLNALIYEVTPVTGSNTPTFTQILSSDFYIIASNNDKGKWVHLPIKKNGHEMLSAKKTYLVAIQTYDVAPKSNGIPAKRILFKSDISTKQRGYVTWVYLSTPQIYNGQSFSWVVTKDLPFIRLNLHKNTVGISEHYRIAGLTVQQNQPNPSGVGTSIHYNLGAAANVQLEVVDMIGRRVFASNEGMKTVGEQVVHLNTSELAPGVYFYTLRAGAYAITKRMLVRD
jgi:hypothetical protein